MQYTPITSFDAHETMDDNTPVEDGQLIDAIIDQLNGNTPSEAAPVPSRYDPPPISPPGVVAKDIDSQSDQGPIPTPTQPSVLENSHQAKEELCSDEFWMTVLRMAREPIIVGVVVCLLSSKRIQQRLLEFVPMVMSDNIQGTLSRLILGMVLYMLIKRLL